jgi:dienelactone hydrolase
VAGAFDFVRRQPGVNPARIATLGLSMGGEEALRAAGDGTPLAAVVADGAGASTTGDQRLTDSGLVPQSVSWLTTRAVEIFSGDSEPQPLASIVRRIRVPVLLIASNAKNERTTDETFRSRIGSRATLWYVPDAAHTEAIARHPALYRERVTSFLDSALPGR